MGGGPARSNNDYIKSPNGFKNCPKVVKAIKVAQGLNPVIIRLFWTFRYLPNVNLVGKVKKGSGHSFNYAGL